MPYDSPEEMMKAYEAKITKGMQALEAAENKKIMEQSKKYAGKAAGVKAAKQYTVTEAMKAVKKPRWNFQSFDVEVPASLSFDPIQPVDQTPRQWNLITIKRCTVSREEFHFYGGLQAVLAKKGFPVVSPENGDLMISWFDPKEGVAYYELCRVQDQGELMKYMQEKFVQEVAEDGGRAISLE